MNRTCAVLLAVSLWVPALLAQSVEQAVKQANDALLAASSKGDSAAYGKLIGDDLRWVDSDGTVFTKAQRLTQIKAPSTSGRTFRDLDVKSYGNTAVAIFRSDWTVSGKKMSERVQRVFVNRNGQWQLVSHSTTPMDPSK
jgi:ketosteroid isomerase-like protein